jgi:hypothetical protein
LKARWIHPSYNKSSFQPGEVVNINIPTGRRGSFLNTRMCYLKFSVTENGIDAIHTIAADFNIALFFSTLDFLYYGSNFLEQTHEYGLLVNLWHDIFGYSAVFGLSGSLIEGQAVWTSNPRTRESMAGGNSRVLCIPLLSGIIGVL